MMDFDTPFQPGMMPPDGTIDASDRESFLWLYSGIAADAPVVPPVIVVVPSTQGGGPGWNLFQALPDRKRKVDTLEAEIRSLLEKAEEAETPKEKRAIVKEIKAVAREIVAEAPKYRNDVPLKLLADALDKLQSMEVSMVVYLDNAKKVIEAKRRQDEDDMEAITMIMRLI